MTAKLTIEQLGRSLSYLTGWFRKDSENYSEARRRAVTAVLKSDLPDDHPTRIAAGKEQSRMTNAKKAAPAPSKENNPTKKTRKKTK